MKLNYKLNGLDCANCGAKLERAIKKIEGVESVSISFMTLNMVIEINESNLDETILQVFKVAHKVMPKLDIKRR